MTRRTFFVFVGGAILVAAALQFVDLGGKSMWADEVYTARIVTQEDLEGFADRFSGSERQPPLHYLLLYGWEKIAGDSDAALRIPSGILSVGAVALMAVLGWQVLGRREGALGAWFLAASPLVLLYGRMARYYSTALATSLASTVLLVMALKRKKSGPWWVAYSAATIAMMMSGYTNGGLLVAHAVFVAIFIRGEEFHGRRGFLAALIAVAGFMGLWTVFQLSRISGFASAPRPFELVGPKAVALDLLYPFYSFSLGETIFPWHPLAAAAMLVVAAVFLWGARHLVRGPGLSRLPLVVLGVMIPLTALVYQLFIRDIPFSTLPSRAIAALPFLLLLLVAGVSRLRARLMWTALAVLALAWGAGIWNYFQDQQFHNPTFAVPGRQVLASISARACPADVILADEPLKFDYYYRPKKGLASLVVAEPQDEARSDIENLNPDRVWFVELARSGSRADRPLALKSWLEREYMPAEQERYLPLDPIYVRLQEAVLGYEAERNELTVTLFESESARSCG